MLRSAKKLLLWRFVCLQDNDPQQESQNCTGLTLKVLQWHIPDLNRIHNLWQDMKIAACSQPLFH